MFYKRTIWRRRITVVRVHLEYWISFHGIKSEKETSQLADGSLCCCEVVWSCPTSSVQHGHVVRSWWNNRDHTLSSKLLLKQCSGMLGMYSFETQHCRGECIFIVYRKIFQNSLTFTSDYTVYFFWHSMYLNQIKSYHEKSYNLTEMAKLHIQQVYLIYELSELLMRNLYQTCIKVSFE